MTMMSQRKPLTKVLASLIVGMLFFGGQANADIVVIIHPQNPIQQLSQGEVSRLFMGRIHLFPRTNEKIRLLDQPESASTFQSFYKKLINIRINTLKRYRAAYLFSGKGKLPIILDSNQAVKEYVSAHKDAIGYINDSELDTSVKVVFRYTLP